MENFLLSKITSIKLSEKLRNTIHRFELWITGFFQNELDNITSEYEDSIEYWLSNIPKLVKKLKEKGQLANPLTEELERLRKEILERLIVLLKLENASINISRFLQFYRWIELYGDTEKKAILQLIPWLFINKTPFAPALRVLISKGDAVLLPLELEEYYPKSTRKLKWLFQGEGLRTVFFLDKGRMEVLAKLKQKLLQPFPSLNEKMIEYYLSGEEFQHLYSLLESERKNCNKILAKTFWWQRKTKACFNTFLQFIHQNQIRLLYQWGTNLLNIARSLKVISDIHKRANLESILQDANERYRQILSELKRHKSDFAIELEKEIEILSHCIENEVSFISLNERLTESDYEDLLLRLEQGFQVIHPKKAYGFLPFSFQSKLIMQLTYYKKAECLKYSSMAVQEERAEILKKSLERISFSYFESLAKGNDEILEEEHILTHQEVFLVEMLNLLMKLKPSENTSSLLEKINHCQNLRRSGLQGIIYLKKYAQEALGMPVSVGEESFPSNSRERTFTKNRLFFTEQTMSGTNKVYHFPIQL